MLESEKSYRPQAEPIRETKEYTLLRDFSIKTHRKMKST